MTIALISIAISIVGLAWQLTLYVLSGARLRLRLHPVVMTHRGATIQGSEGRWPTKPPEAAILGDGDLWLELAHLSVANIGRTVVWVSMIGLDFGRDAGWRRVRTTVTLRPIAVAGGVPDGSPARLEPGQAVEMYVPVTNAITTLGAGTGHKRLRLRATAVLAGRKAKRSQWRRAWRVRLDSDATYPHAEMTRQVRVYQALANFWPTADIGNLYEAWLEVWVALQDGAGYEVLAAVLSSFIEGPVAQITAAMKLVAAYERSA